MIHFIVPLILLSPNRAIASELKCIDLQGGLSIISKISPHKYEADVWSWGTPKTRVVLFTTETDFSQPGSVLQHFWIQSGSPKTISMNSSDGFTKQVPTLSESATCTAQEKPKVGAIEKSQDDKKAIQYAEALKRNNLEKAQRQAANAQAAKERLALWFNIPLDKRMEYCRTIVPMSRDMGLGDSDCNNDEKFVPHQQFDLYWPSGATAQ